MTNIRLTDEQLVAMISNRLRADDASCPAERSKRNSWATARPAPAEPTANTRRRDVTERLLLTVLADLRALAVAVDARAPRRELGARIGAIVDGIENTLAEA